MGLKTFMKSIVRIVRVSKKPSRRDLALSLKVSSLGTLILGTLGFTIQLVASSLHLIKFPALPRFQLLNVIVVVIVIILAALAYGKKAGWW